MRPRTMWWRMSLAAGAWLSGLSNSPRSPSSAGFDTRPTERAAGGPCCDDVAAPSARAAKWPCPPWACNDPSAPARTMGISLRGWTAAPRPPAVPPDAAGDAPPAAGRALRPAAPLPAVPLPFRWLPRRLGGPPGCERASGSGFCWGRLREPSLQVRWPLFRSIRLRLSAATLRLVTRASACVRPSGWEAVPCDGPSWPGLNGADDDWLGTPNDASPGGDGGIPALAGVFLGRSSAIANRWSREASFSEGRAEANTSGPHSRARAPGTPRARGLPWN
mmetsp:Transcript_19347/g.74211  ORF Transcript_19347/g.74211 Transcript_19347/m.74211 type:complete len:277 (-) Transcript_19347:76-906(-)